MRRPSVILPIAFPMALGCGTDHISVANVDSAGAAGASAPAGGVRNSTNGFGGTASAYTGAGGIGAGGITPTLNAGGTSGGGSSSVAGGSSPLGGAGSGGTSEPSNVGGRLSQAGSGGSAAMGGSVGRAGTGGTTSTGGSSTLAGGGSSPTGGSSAQAGRGGTTSAQGGNAGTKAAGGSSAQAGSSSCGGEFVACGCGCCGGTTPNVVCYYPSLGDSLASIISADAAARASTNCALVGCSLGQRSVCCTDAAVDPSDTSTYSAVMSVGALDRIRIEKRTPSGQCIVLALSSPAIAGTNAFRVSLPGDWGIERASIRDCAQSAEVGSGIGGLGTIAFQSSGGVCTVVVHATVFLAPESGSVQALRFDANGIPLGGVSGIPGCP